MFFEAGQRGQAPIVITAGLAVVVLLATASWQLASYLRGDTDTSTEDAVLSGSVPSEYENLGGPDAGTGEDWYNELVRLGVVSSSTDASSTVAFPAESIENIPDAVAQVFADGYIGLVESGEYTPERGAQLGHAIGASIRAPSDFTPHTLEDLKVDDNTSLERVLDYRADMRDALKGLITDASPELEIFALYVETKNPIRLQELEDAAERYWEASRAVLAVPVPQDAADMHVRIVNALGAYGGIVNQFIRSAESPFTTLAVLKTYNEAEREMLYAFDALASYYVRKSTQ